MEWINEYGIALSVDAQDEKSAPMSVDTWPNYVLGECLREANGDTQAAMAAASYILATQPVPKGFALSVDAQGHEHKGKGEGGGQFVGKGGNSSVSKKALKAAKILWNIVNAAPAATSWYVEKGGYSPRVAKIAYFVALAGDYSIPGLPAGSAAVMIAATIGKPLAPYRAVKSLINSVRSRLKKSVAMSADEPDRDIVMAVADALESADNQDWFLNVLAVAIEEEGDIKRAVELAKAVVEENPEPPTDAAFSEEFESKHPRGQGGEFVKKGEGSKSDDANLPWVEELEDEPIYPHRQSVRSMAKQAIEDSGLDEKQKQKYHAAFTAATDHMPPEAMEAISKSIKTMHFFGDSVSLTKQMQKEEIKLSKQNIENLEGKGGDIYRNSGEFQGAADSLIGLWKARLKKARSALKELKTWEELGMLSESNFVAGAHLPVQQILYLDGDKYKAESRSSNAKHKIKKSDYNTEVYAHELGHAIAAGLGGIDKSDEFKKIWQEEISGSKTTLTSYAKTNSQEGFAEFSRLLYSRGIPLDDLEKTFPKTSQFFKEYKLWPHRKTIASRRTSSTKEQKSATAT